MHCCSQRQFIASIICFQLLLVSVSFHRPALCWHALLFFLDIGALQDSVGWAAQAPARPVPERPTVSGSRPPRLPVCVHRASQQYPPLPNPQSARTRKLCLGRARRPRSIMRVVSESLRAAVGGLKGPSQPGSWSGFKPPASAVLASSFACPAWQA